MSHRSGSAGMSSSPLVAPGASKNLQTILTGRKAHRVTKDNEMVWPPHLEAALVEGLEQYVPAESKSARGLVRFPNRNKFISEYILKKTGLLRTAKQVGSRIQQLRDTAAGKGVLKEISDRHYEMLYPTRRSPSASSSSPDPPAHVPVDQVYITVSPGGPSAPPPASRTTPYLLHSPTAVEFSEPRPLRNIDPTVTFLAPAPAQLFSTCHVLCNNSVVHEGEPVPMDVGAAPHGQGYLFSTPLAPAYWGTLCNAPDILSYAIVQTVSRMRSPGVYDDLHSVEYHFTEASYTAPLSPFMLGQEYAFGSVPASPLEGLGWPQQPAHDPAQHMYYAAGAMGGPSAGGGYQGRPGFGSR